MTDAASDANIERLGSECDHLRVKLSLARDHPTQDVEAIGRIERSIVASERELAAALSRARLMTTESRRARLGISTKIDHRPR